MAERVSSSSREVAVFAGCAEATTIDVTSILKLWVSASEPDVCHATAGPFFRITLLRSRRAAETEAAAVPSSSLHLHLRLTCSPETCFSILGTLLADDDQVAVDEMRGTALLRYLSQLSGLVAVGYGNSTGKLGDFKESPDDTNVIPEELCVCVCVVKCEKDRE